MCSHNLTEASSKHTCLQHHACITVLAGKPFFDTLTTFMSSGRICAMELVAPNAIAKWRQVRDAHCGL